MRRQERVLLFILLACHGLCPAPLYSQQGCPAPEQYVRSDTPNIFSKEQEAIVGDIMVEELRLGAGVIDDEEIIAPLRRMGDRLLRQLTPGQTQIQFLVLDSPAVNAYSMPNGQIYVTRKIIADFRNEDEMAGVLAHEIGHQLTRNVTAELTKRLREVLGVTQVGDRKDILDKYNQLKDNAARKPVSPGKTIREVNLQQEAADQAGILTAARAGFRPEALADWFERFTGAKRGQGGFLPDLFSSVTPDTKRLREMMKVLGEVAPACREASARMGDDEFRQWRQSVIAYSGSGKKESVHGVLARTPLNPPLRGELMQVRFSPDGKYLLAQDDAGIHVLSREPLSLLFRIEAPGALRAHFTPDSRSVAFVTGSGRVEIWSIPDEERTEVHELVLKSGCPGGRLSPDGRTLACVNVLYGVELFDVRSGDKVMSTDGAFDVVTYGRGAPREVYFEYSPDGHYLIRAVSAARTLPNGEKTAFISVVAVDLVKKALVPMKGPMESLLAGGFAFIDSNKVFARNILDPAKSVLMAFPSGEILKTLPAPEGRISAPTRGEFLVVRPYGEYAVGLADLNKNAVTRAIRSDAFDLDGDTFATERANGEVALYDTASNGVRASLQLPLPSLSYVGALAVSPDFRWLAMSGKARGGVWRLEDGKGRFQVLGFEGAYFDSGGMLYANFPRRGDQEKRLARLDPTRGEATEVRLIEEARAPAQPAGSAASAGGSEQNREHGVMQVGRFLMVDKAPGKDSVSQENAALEMHDLLTGRTLWARALRDKPPFRWIAPEIPSLVFGWLASDKAVGDAAEKDPSLKRRLESLKAKNRSALLQVIDVATGEVLHNVLIDTGEGSFRIVSVYAAGDSAVVADNQNRVAVYSLKSGSALGKVFGSGGEIDPTGRLLCVQNEPGQLAIYDLAQFEKRDQYAFSHRVVMTSFSADARKLFVLTANQVAYTLDVSPLIRAAP